MTSFLLRLSSISRPKLSARHFSSFNSLIDVSKLTITQTENPKPKVPKEDLIFGHTFTDHMLEIDWDDVNGWQDPKIIPFQDFKISPAAAVLHYGLECFEGMKAFKDDSGRISLFRPDMNMTRLNKSMTRLAMPNIDGNDAFLECIKQLLLLDQSWFPDGNDYSMYIRPTAIATTPFLGVHPPHHVKLYAILSPTGPYYKTGFKPIKLYADTEHIRAWPGGVGDAKVGGNYAPTMLPSKYAAEKHGCSQVLWLYGDDHQITEVGAMNICFVLQRGNDVELVTSPLHRGDILAGVTRDSILKIARNWSEFDYGNLRNIVTGVKYGGNFTVSERFLTMGELKDAAEDGRFLEAFGVGTAAVVSPVSSIIYQNEEIKAALPTAKSGIPTTAVLDGNPVTIAETLRQNLLDIQHGRRKNHPWHIAIN